VDREYVSAVGKLQDRLLILLDLDRLMSDFGQLGSVALPQAQASGASL
jgi:chemotaxis signal transduction protein